MSWGSLYREKEPLRTKLAIAGSIAAGNLDLALMEARRATTTPPERKQAAMDGVAQLSALRANDFDLIRAAGAAFGLTEAELKGSVQKGVQTLRGDGYVTLPANLEAEFGLKNTATPA